MANILVRNWLNVALTCVGLIYPVQISKEALADSRPDTGPKMAVVSVELQSTPKHAKSNAFQSSIGRYNYAFSGQATAADNQPLANAHLTIHVISEYAADIYRTTTDANGHFNVAVLVTGSPSETLSWEIHGINSNLKTADLEGHQILTDEHTVQVESALRFAEI